MDLDAIIRVSLVLILGFLLPILIGRRAYIWSMKKNRYIKAMTLLVAPSIYFLMSYLFFSRQAQILIDKYGYACGAFGFAALFSTIGGTALHFLIAIAMLTITAKAWKRRSIEPTT